MKKTSEINLQGKWVNLEVILFQRISILIFLQVCDSKLGCNYLLYCWDGVGGRLYVGKTWSSIYTKEHKHKYEINLQGKLAILEVILFQQI